MLVSKIEKKASVHIEEPILAYHVVLKPRKT
jgi:hypothetical protein